MPLYLGSKTVSENINMGDTVIQNTFDLFDVKWSDHIINNESWMCADDFNWIDGSVFSAAWNELKSEWDLATVDSTPAQQDIIGDITISYWKSPKGYKLVEYGGDTPETNENLLQQLYDEVGIAWYYLIDTTGQIRFKLPRTKYGFVGVRSGAGNFVDESLPNITGTAATDGFTINNLEPTGVFYNASMTYTGRSGDTTTQSNGLGFNASRSSPIYQDGANVQQKSTEMHLYFYLADFVRTPLESNLNTFITETKETLNEKVNVSDYSADKTLIENDINTLKTTKITQTDLDNTINTQRTNCITKIPQNIKLELNDGTLTLKAGSKVYVPNGVGVFKEILVNSDISLTDTTNYNNLFVFYIDGRLERILTGQVFSGTTAPSGNNFLYWYDTNNNLIKRTTDGGSNWTSGDISFPLGLFTTNGSGFTSINQVFNGFGYIGSTTFALPGVEGLIPNGKNDDGSLNNTKFTTTSVLTRINPNKYVGTFVITLRNNDLLEIGAEAYGYNKDKNINYNTISNEPFVYMNAGTYSQDSTGRITSLKSKTTFQAVDANSIQKINLLDPNNKLDNPIPVNTTFDTTGYTYTLPFDGYLNIAWNSENTTGGNYVTLSNGASLKLTMANNSVINDIFVLPPLPKGTKLIFRRDSGSGKITGSVLFSIYNIK